MSWKSVKNILIILLLAVNILLAFFAYNHYVPARITDSNTALSAAKTLRSSGIFVTTELLSVRNDSLDILYTDFDREEYVCLAAAMLLGKEADGIYMLPNGVRAETLDGESAYIGYDMSLEFVARDKKDIIESAVAASNSASGDESEAACALIESRFAIESGSLDRTLCKKSGNIIFVNVQSTENNIPLYSMNAIFGLEGERIVYAEGKHFFGVPLESENAQLLDRINILFSEKERGMRGNVKNIHLCYALYEDSENGRMMYVPSYEIIYDSGKTSVINAISKKLYQSSFQE